MLVFINVIKGFFKGAEFNKNIFILVGFTSVFFIVYCVYVGCGCPKSMQSNFIDFGEEKQKCE